MDILIGAVILFALLVSAVVIAPTVKMAMDIAPFLYTNTRCSARSGTILTRKEYDGLLACTYEKEIYAALEDTAYRHVVEHANRFGTASEELDKELYQTYDWLETIMPEKIRPILAAMKRKFEIADIKAAYTRLREGEAPGELNHVQDPNLRLKLEATADTSSFATALEGTPYGEGINGSVEGVNTELDLQYLRTVLQIIEESKDQKGAAPFKEYWRRLIDLINIRLTLRRITERIEGLSLVEGGFIPAERLMGVTDKSQLTEALQGTQYDHINTEATGLALENEFHKFIAIEGSRMNAKHPLKGGPIVKYIIQKELEVRNLNILLKLKAEGFTNEEVNAFLVV